jgi:hypothetical protein
MMTHNIGENVVNAENMQTGNIVQIRENDGMVEIAYANGATEWVDASQVTTLLIETDPAPTINTTWKNLNEG